MTSQQSSGKHTPQNLYAMQKLMQETRRIAAEYRQTTGETLPVTSELARFDCRRLLDLELPKDNISGVDLVGKPDSDWDGSNVQIKGRVIFPDSSSRSRIGQINFDGKWNVIMLVLFNDNYNPFQIYALKRESLLKSVKGESINPRGLMSVAKFKAVATLVWQA